MFSGHRGETIVEVLISITILSLAMGTGYAIINKSNKGLQANKEQFQAQQIANQQIEYLRLYNTSLPVGSNRPAFNNSSDCLKIDPATLKPIAYSSSADCELIDSSIYNVDISCISGGVSGGACDTDRNKISTYFIYITWDNVKGGQSSLELQYAM